MIVELAFFAVVGYVGYMVIYPEATLGAGVQPKPDSTVREDEVRQTGILRHLSDRTTGESNANLNADYRVHNERNAAGNRKWPLMGDNTNQALSFVRKDYVKTEQEPHTFMKTAIKPDRVITRPQPDRGQARTAFALTNITQDPNLFKFGVLNVANENK